MGWEMGGRFKREETCVHLWLIHVDVWQKSTQHCKAIPMVDSCHCMTKPIQHSKVKKIKKSKIKKIKINKIFFKKKLLA